MSIIFPPHQHIYTTKWRSSREESNKSRRKPSYNILLDYERNCVQCIVSELEGFSKIKPSTTTRFHIYCWSSSFFLLYPSCFALSFFQSTSFLPSMFETIINLCWDGQQEQPSSNWTKSYELSDETTSLRANELLSIKWFIEQSIYSETISVFIWYIFSLGSVHTRSRIRYKYNTKEI